MQAVSRPVNFARSGPWFMALLVVTLVAFWPSYLTPPRLRTSSIYTHLHAVTATIWMLMLIVQPIAIRTRRLHLHRLIGRASYVVAPLMLLSMLLLASHRIRTASADFLPIQIYILYLQLAPMFVFGLSYALAIYHRRNAALHARFIVCTALTLIDPIFVRLLLQVAPVPAWNYQWATFLLTDLVLVLLMVLERNSRQGRRLFPAMLVVFVLTQIPALFGWTSHNAWQTFARWFASLPLT